MALVRLLVVSDAEVLTLEVEAVSRQILGRSPLDLSPELGGELDAQSSSDLIGYPALDGEDIAQLAVVGLRPELPLLPGVDQLSGYPNPFPLLPHRTLQQ